MTKAKFTHRVEVYSAEGNLIRVAHAALAASLCSNGAYRHPLDRGKLVRAIVYSRSNSELRAWPKLPVKPNNQLKESKSHQLSRQTSTPAKRILFTPLEIHSHVFDGSKYGGTNRVVA